MSVATIPDPPEGGPGGGPPCESFEDLFESVQAFAKDNGFAVVKKAAGNRHAGFGPTYYELHCDRGASRPPRGSGVRNTSTRKIGCPWKMVATAPKGDGHLWRLRHQTIHQQHNHEPSSKPSAHAVHRKWRQPQQDLLSSISRNTAIQAREAGTIVRDTFGIEYTNQDIRNERARQRLQELDGYTPTQALIEFFDQEGVYYVKRVDPDTNELTALFWTLDYCIQMWKRYPTVLSFDNTYKTNRFHMPLFNITGTSNIHSTFNVGFGLVDNERLDGFKWLLEAMEEIRARYDLPVPLVCLTDKEENLRTALKDIWPGAQLQLCVFHINANVVLNVKKKWKTPLGVDNEAADAVAFEREDEDGLPDPESTDLQDLNSLAHSDQGIESLPQQIPHSKKGIFML